MIYVTVYMFDGLYTYTHLHIFPHSHIHTHIYIYICTHKWVKITISNEMLIKSASQEIEQYLLFGNCWHKSKCRPL